MSKAYCCLLCRSLQSIHLEAVLMWNEIIKTKWRFHTLKTLRINKILLSTYAMQKKKKNQNVQLDKRPFVDID